MADMSCAPQASDPDVGESSELQYSLVKSTSLVEVEANTGQIYVLDASSVGDGQFPLDVKATDKHGLSTTATVQVRRKRTRKKKRTLLQDFFK